MTPSITESNVFQALGDFLANILPVGTAVVRGQQNRVAEPAGTNYAVMWPLNRERIALNTDSYTSIARNVVQAMKITLQVDLHGSASAENATLLSTLARDEYGVNFFASDTLGALGIQPLYTSEPRQMPFMDGEQQSEEKWTVEVTMQVNPVISLPQDSANQLSVKTISNVSTFKA